MLRVLMIILTLFSVNLAGCSDNGKQLYETAQFEEKQHNLEHAKQLYGELAKKHPASEYGKKAEERLKTLNVP